LVGFVKKIVVLSDMMKRFLLFLLIFAGGEFIITPLNAQITANFTASPTSGCAPLIVQFTDQSTGPGINSWQWNCGGGNTPTKQSPLVAYLVPGVYNVTLTVKNTGTGVSNTVTKTAFITVFSTPVAKFTATDTTGCAPLAVSFTDLSTPGSGKITKWSWSFGDGSPNSNAQNPTHTYSASKTYSVTLTVTDTNGCTNSINLPGLVQVLNSTLNAGFTASPNVGCSAPATINFTNTSTSGGTLTYSWNFGDTHTSTSTSPSNTYSAPGTYTVSLTANSSNGCSKTATSTISVLGGSNVAFTASTTSACLGTNISFGDSTKPAPTSVKWNFGDGNSSILSNPAHTYSAPGTYSVRLVVSFAGLCPDSLTKTAFITVNPGPVVSFSADTLNACATPFKVHFTDHTIGATTWNWSFGNGSNSTLASDSTIYNTSPGTFNVKLVVTTANGCKDSLTKFNYISVKPPVAGFTSTPDSGCAPLLVNFKDTSFSREPIKTWAWTFGDPSSGASNASVLENPTHTFNAIGTYTVNLSLINSYGCASSTQGTVIITNKPVIGFFVSKDSCALTPIVFTDTSVVSTFWKWDFGDGKKGMGKLSQHLYDTTGFF